MLESCKTTVDTIANGVENLEEIGHYSLQIIKPHVVNVLMSMK